MYRRQSQTGRFTTAGVQHIQKDAKPTAPIQPDPEPQRPIEESVFRQPKTEKRKKKYQRG
jgi:hypothetical protein